MLQKNIMTKHFNHMNCDERVAVPVLFEARPKGQSRVTLSQSNFIRQRTSMHHVQRSTSLLKRLTKTQSKRQMTQKQLPNVPEMAIQRNSVQHYQI